MFKRCLLNLFLYLLFELCDFISNVSKGIQCILKQRKINMNFRSEWNEHLEINIEKEIKYHKSGLVLVYLVHILHRC